LVGILKADIYGSKGCKGSNHIFHFLLCLFINILIFAALKAAAK
jgi:hypothetical protein